jgi:hypothetical protein
MSGQYFRNVKQGPSADLVNGQAFTLLQRLNEDRERTFRCIRPTSLVARFQTFDDCPHIPLSCRFLHTGMRDQNRALMPRIGPCWIMSNS